MNIVKTSSNETFNSFNLMIIEKKKRRKHCTNEKRKETKQKQKSLPTVNLVFNMNEKSLKEKLNHYTFSNTQHK